MPNKMLPPTQEELNNRQEIVNYIRSYKDSLKKNIKHSWEEQEKLHNLEADFLTNSKVLTKNWETIKQAVDRILKNNL